MQYVSNVYERLANPVKAMLSGGELQATKYLNDLVTKKAFSILLIAPTTFVTCWYCSSSIHAWITRLRASEMYNKAKDKVSYASPALMKKIVSS